MKILNKVNDTFKDMCNRKRLDDSIHLSEDDYPLLERIKSGDLEAEKILEARCSVVQLALKKLIDNMELVMPNIYFTSLENNYYIIDYEEGEIYKYGRKNYEIRIKDGEIWCKKKVMNHGAY